MVLHSFDMNMQSLADKKITICLVLFLLDLFLDGELSISHILLQIMHASNAKIAITAY